MIQRVQEQTGKNWFNVILLKRVAHVFVYGSLLDSKTRERVKTQILHEIPATINGYRRTKVAGVVEPCC